MATKTADDYVSLITPWQSTKARFVETVRAGVQPLADAQSVVAALPADFDIDTAIGAQLDVVGQWVGRSRNVSLPIPNAYFAWSDPLRGWARGYWKGPYSQQYGITTLDDETYRRLLRAVIMGNHWDGTIPGAQAVFDAFFDDPETFVFVLDKAQVPYPQITFAWSDPARGWGVGMWRSPSLNGASVGAVDVAMSVCVSGKIPSPVLLGLLAQDALRIKPGGVTVSYRVTSKDRAPVFGWGVQNQYVSGWGTGAWGVSPEYLLENL
jgi:hypothetical protein